MKHLVIGTAGHIDHGKTTLIQALTGRNTDRLKEEMKRGISIELGFTHFDLPGGIRAGIIDVPGHERFIRHMLAGVGGVDLVMLVIAADEGVMAQTKEHLDILQMLSIKKGIVVLTKADIVEPEWLEMVKEDVRESLQETFLESAPIIAVDSVSKRGINELIEKLTDHYQEVDSRDEKAPFRMPIDRVFTITGFGTVVTGTLMEGSLNIEETVQLYPGEETLRIRNIQVHGETVKKAYAGQRVALNLSGIKKELIQRGDYLAKPGSLKSTMMVDGRLTLLKNAPRSLKQRDRVRIYHGASEILARIVILEKDVIEPGESTLVQFRLEENAVFKKGDNIIIRFYSPMETLGGAVIIEPSPEKHKSMQQDIIDKLMLKESGGIEADLEQALQKISDTFPDKSILAESIGCDESDIKEVIGYLQDQNLIYSIEDKYYIHRDYYESIIDEISMNLINYHKKNPLRQGMLKEELKSRVFSNPKNRAADLFLELISQEKIICIEGKFVSAQGFSIKLTPEQKEILNQIETIYLESLYSPPRLEEVKKGIKGKEKTIQQVIEMMMGDKLLRLQNDLVLHQKAYEGAKEKIKEHFINCETLSVAEFRDLLGTSRKYAVGILEYLDQEKFTKREGDNRTLGKK
ncbi:selenocysteine-specific translation elongation factor [Tindallia californiensis]|uniref:Selenocysteine-specific elongation factor n=1 Tax=Tindallia californiensis TaxID=159292 RepID=A0A1H3NFK6_9FIRM|nr:selenocysteine-specific translation elongation factor [Tindallia californiensis]SDY86959.1 selenocysteine-specific translation elongation factor SelB [Tindallia californiensis]